PGRRPASPGRRPGPAGPGTARTARPGTHLLRDVLLQHPLDERERGGFKCILLGSAELRAEPLQQLGPDAAGHGGPPAGGATVNAKLVPCVVVIVAAALARPGLPPGGAIPAADPPEPLVIAGDEGVVISLAWRPDGKALASAGEDKTVRVWDPATGKQIAELKGHTQQVMSVAWRPGGKALASAGE